MHPREVFGPAVRLLGVASIVLADNHPSGDPAPSRDDIRLTRQLVEAGALLDIKVHDHVVIGNGATRSCRSRRRGSSDADDLGRLVRAQAHARPLPREVLDELHHLEQYARDARAHGIEAEKFLAMVEAERTKGYAGDEAYQRVLRRLNIRSAPIQIRLVMSSSFRRGTCAPVQPGQGQAECHTERSDGATTYVVSDLD